MRIVADNYCNLFILNLGFLYVLRKYLKVCLRACMGRGSKLVLFNVKV